VLHARSEETDTARELLSAALAGGGEEARTAAAEFPILNPLLDE